jgi:Asp-tRNA(Asn)/Glu-tRNA(Gln) amidotransferase C subunit
MPPKKEKKPETIVRKDHSVIIPPATLRERAMTLGGNSKDGFDTSALARAEEALATLATDFTAWMRDEATKLETAREAFRQAPETEDSQQVLYRAAHDIRGQGRTFGYPLAGEIADGLCDLIDGCEEMDAHVLELIDAHIDAIRAVVRDDVRDEKNAMARNVVAELKGAREAIIGVNRFIKINADVY